MKTITVRNAYRFTLLCLFLLSGMARAEIETITYLHSDHLGSPVLARDNQGNTLWREDYSPWGERLTRPSGNSADIGYTGHYEETDIGLTYAQARWYDPQVGRFLAPDAVDFTSGGAAHFNRYGYANSNPYRFVDLDGRDAVGVVYKGYQVNTGFGFNLPLGHAGVLLINNAGGFTRYYEYGRYDPNGKGIVGEKLDKMKGNIRNVPVPNVVIGKDGKPTQKSLNGIYEHLSKTAGKGYDAVTEYHEGADFIKMEKYVQDTANDKSREKYSVPFCSCYDFKDSVISAGNKKE